MPDDSSAEVMLAQEEGVICRGSGTRKEVEAAFGVGETQGTLVLTDRRLIYVHGGEKEEDLRIGAFSQKRLFFADVEDLDSVSMDAASLEIPIATIAGTAGKKVPGAAPKLEVKWSDHGIQRVSEFVQQVTGGSRKKNLNDWAAVIDKLRNKKIKILPLPPAPSVDELEGKVLAALGDMQEKGLFTIEEELEGRYNVKLDPDDVESACEKLASIGLVKNVSAKGEGPFYRKVSPLGEDDLGN
ncbi:MAG TPA: hypothetical protein VLX56_01425 [Nitrososphaerales archaeon]|nr:hypothetical protein [Nitrososphaerales archaeon]